MANTISYVVVPFERDERNQVVPGVPLSARTGDIAVQRAKALLSTGETVGVAALWHASDGVDYSDTFILATFGEVALGALVG